MTHDSIPLTVLPQEYQHFRSELGKAFYQESLGIERHDFAARRTAQLRNFDFFGAPTAAIVCMDRDLTPADTLAVGMYLQSFLLALTTEGVGSCVEVSVAGYSEVIRKAVGIPDQLDIICGVAIGFEDPAEKLNWLRVKKQSAEETTVLLEE